ncbi:MAG TPA: TonB-dependent receptor [Hyphomonadaceae bacterium]|nr:TonB-dependent receptor [Hyphomonadaceae bacterium]
MRGSYTAASWIALATAMTVFAGPAFAQQPPTRVATEGAKGAVGDVVVIYGDRDSSDPGSYSVIGEQQIAETAANHPAEILNTIPGVNVQMNSGQELLVAIRSPVLPAGAGQGSFLILENGIPTRAPAFGNVNALFEVHHETADAIEVVRGPGSVRYGSNAVHGLMNFIDPEPGAQEGQTLTLSANSLQRYRADATANFKTGDVANWIGLSVMDDGGWRDSSGVDQQKLTVRSKFGGETWNAVATVAAVNLNQETAGFIQGLDAYKDEDIATTNPNPEAYRDAWAARANVRFETNVGGGQLTVTPFALTQRMIFIQHFLPDQSTEKNGHESLGLMTRYDFGPDNLRWAVGADVQWADGFLKEIQSQPSFGGTPSNRTFPRGIHYDYDVETWTAALYGEVDWDFATNWSLLAGVRGESHFYDYVTNKTPGTTGRFRVAPSRTDRYKLLTPKVGVTYSGFEDVIVYANYARGARAPQTSDQYRLQNLQTIRRLDVENIDSYEVGARGQLAGIDFDVALYTMKKDNFFFRDSDGLNVPNGRTEHTGLEVSLAGELGEFAGGKFLWNGNFAWSDQIYAFNRNVAAAAEDIFEGDQIDTAPPWLADAGIGWQSPQFSLFLTADYVGEYFANAANTATYDGHLIGHLRGGWKFSDDLEAFVIVRNITDERYADRADFASGQYRYFPGEPVNATIGVRVRH